MTPPAAKSPRRAAPRRAAASPRVLHVAAEVYPLVKTGGLADVVGALPPALAAAGADARLLLPGYPAILDAVERITPVAEIGPAFGAAKVTLLAAQLPGSGLRAYLLDAPLRFRRPGNPYVDARNHDWPDNLQRFALLGWAAAQLAAGGLDPAWTPELVHAHDWHAAAACAYLAALGPQPVASVFTVHNLAYQGRFPHDDFGLLGLPARFMNSAGIEFHGDVSLIKAGLKFADRVTTVSPTYAREIATPEFGHGLDGVIRGRGQAVCGILNGVDTAVWDPAHDAVIAANYDATSLEGKAACKQALQREMGLTDDAAAPLFGVVSRLTSQKGLDLLLGALPALLAQGGQLVLQGAGDAALENAFRDAEAAHRGRIAVRIGYDEAVAHRIVAGADVILVPSRFEPCGLTQLYGLRYGTLPLVRRVGGLADTVVDAHGEALAQGTATGFAFDAAAAEALGDAIGRAAALHRDATAWRRLMASAMAQDFSWGGSARAYLALYREAIAQRAGAR